MYKSKEEVEKLFIDEWIEASCEQDPRSYMVNIIHQIRQDDRGAILEEIKNMREKLDNGYGAWALDDVINYIKSLDK